jgi:hypothetical protein
MSNLTAIVTLDGEVIPASDFGSIKEFQYKILNSLEFDTLKEFFIKKTIIQAVKQKHELTNGSNGVTSVELINLFKWNDIEFYIDELERKKVIQKKQGVNLEMYFNYKK